MLKLEVDNLLVFLLVLYSINSLFLNKIVTYYINERRNDIEWMVLKKQEEK